MFHVLHLCTVLVKFSVLTEVLNPFNRKVEFARVEMNS